MKAARGRTGKNFGTPGARAATGSPASVSRLPPPSSLPLPVQDSCDVTRPDPNPVHPAAMPVEKLLDECRVQRTRGSGPGGQHRNKVETAIVVTHLPSGLTGKASERRSQHANREQALFRLRVQLAIHVRCRVQGAPSPLWKSRTSGGSAGKITIAPVHDDFPALLAEALDYLQDCDGNPAAAADRLGLSTSQLIKLLKLEPLAWQALNESRKQTGETPLR